MPVGYTLATCTTQIAAASACFDTILASCRTAVISAPQPYRPVVAPPPPPPNPPLPPKPPPRPPQACSPPPSPPTPVASAAQACFSSIGYSIFKAVMAENFAAVLAGDAGGTANSCSALASFPCMSSLVGLLAANPATPWCLATTSASFCACVHTVAAACPQGVAAADGTSLASMIASYGPAAACTQCPALNVTFACGAISSSGMYSSSASAQKGDAAVRRRVFFLVVLLASTISVVAMS